MIVMTIVIIGIVIGIGVLVLDQFGTVVKISATVNNETIAMTNGVGTTANDDVTSVFYFVNSTDPDEIRILYNDTEADYGFNFTTAGAIEAAGAGGNYNISYIYDADTPATTATFGTRDAVDDFVTWIPVIIIILAAAIILGLVTKSFRQ